MDLNFLDHFGRQNFFYIRIIQDWFTLLVLLQREIPVLQLNKYANWHGMEMTGDIIGLNIPQEKYITP